jgi:hypothetical protein
MQYLLAALLCTLIWSPSRAEESWLQGNLSPGLKEFMASHREALRTLTNSFSEVFSNRSVRVLYFYSNNESEAKAYHFYPGTVGIAEVFICIREDQKPLDQFITLLFETLNSRGEAEFAKLVESARSRNVSKQAFARGILRIEFEATKSTRDLLIPLKASKKEMKESHYYHSHPIAGGVFEDKKALAFVRHRATRHGHEKQSQETKANEV